MQKIKFISVFLVMLVVLALLCSCDGLEGLIGSQDSEQDSEREDIYGEDGTALLTGEGAPSKKLGDVGDSYIDLTTWDFYIKEAGGWTLGGNLKSAGDDSDEASALNGAYTLHHIVVESISGGNKKTYNLGDDYYGMQLRPQSISVSLNNGCGVMSYSFEQSVSTNITYEVVDDKFIMNCEDAVDLFNNGNPQHRFELSIEEIYGKICFVLTASAAYSVFSYYVIEQ